MTPWLSHAGIRGRVACRRRIDAAGVAFVLLLAGAVGAAAQEPSSTPPLRPGDIVVVIDRALAGNPGALVKVDPSTGVQTTLSEFADPSQGPIGAPPPGLPNPPTFEAVLAVQDAATIFVAHPTFGTDAKGALFRVDTSTGFRTILSDFGDPSQGPPLGTGKTGLDELVVEPSGDFLILDRRLGARTLARVSRSTGVRAILTDFNDPAQGPVLDPRGVVVDQAGQIAVASALGGTNGEGAIVRVDSANGTRTMLSDFGDPTQGPSGRVVDLTIDHSGDILGFGRAETVPRALLRVDPMTGLRTFLTSVNGCVVTGFFSPSEPVVEDTGDVLIWGRGVDLPGPVGRVDAVTGECTFVGSAPAALYSAFTRDLAVVPTPVVNGLVSLSVAGTALEPSTGDPHAPAGVFRIAATFTNISAMPIRNPFFRVAELTGGNRLVSGDRPPDLIRMGGSGSRQHADVGIDGVLSPGESVEVEFAIGLHTRQPFLLLVNVLGEPDTTESSP